MDMYITPVGFGTAAVGGSGWEAAWGPQDDRESIAAIHRALDHGVNWIDTAPVYGLGHSEEVVARALKGISEKPLIFTKCGLVWDEEGRVGNNLKGDSIPQECEDSLRRLRTDVIDLYQIHWPIPDEDIEEAWSAMAELKEKGKVRHIGVSNFSVEQMERAQRIAPVETLQPPYNMLTRDIEEEVLPYCQENDIGVIVYSPMLRGLLTGKMTPERVQNLPPNDWRRSLPDFQEPRLSKILKLTETLREIGHRHGRSPAEVAIAWTLRQQAVTGAIVGGRRPDQVSGVVGAANFRLGHHDLEEIEAFLHKQH